MENLWLILVALVAYLLGSIPTAYLLSGKKILEGGSGNVGAMNTFRVTGSLKPLVLTLFIDAAKGATAVAASRWWLLGLGYNAGLGVMTASFFVVAGHNYSVILKFLVGEFKGGRGLASLMGVLLVLNWILPFLCLGVVILAIIGTEYGMKRRIEQGFRKLFSVVGSQILGRVIGLVICLIPIYFLLPKELFPTFPLLLILPAALLSYWAHFDRLRKYLEGIKKN